MSDDVTTYLEMQRREYAANVAKSDFSSDEFERSDDREFVVGWYAMHEKFDYEGWLLDGVDLGPDAVAIDYGCGPGRMLKRMKVLFARVDGTDISAEVLDVAGRHCADMEPPPKLFVSDGQGVPPGHEGAYDVAYSVICLQHICVHTIRRRILESLFEALEPGGLLTFQMGYGPGHRALVAYDQDAADARGTNGEADVTVLHPAEIAKDLSEIGFVDLEYALSPTGPGDTHAAWIFVRASKPGTGASIVRKPAQSYFGFRPMLVDDDAVAHVRHLHMRHSIKQRVNALTRQADSLVEKLQQAQAAIAQRDLTVVQRDLALAHRDHILEQRANILEQRAQTLAQRDQAIAERGRIIAQRDQAIADRDRAIERRDKGIADRDRVLEDRERILAEKNRLIANLDQVISRRDLVIAQRDMVIADRDRAIELQAQTIAKRDESILALQREKDWLSDVAAFTRGDRDTWRRQAEHMTGQVEQVNRKAVALERQLRRLRTADRGRVARLIDDLITEAQAGSLRVGILGAGEHTEWLFRETPLQTLPSLFLFDSGQPMWGRTVGGLIVRPSSDITVMQMDAVIVSSLAFQDEMAGFLESLNRPALRIIRLYP
jgi:SAM-dependent methyltransferase